MGLRPARRRGDRPDRDPPLTGEEGIRPATPADLPLLRDIERAAGAAFRGVGMAFVAEDEPPSVEDLRRFRADGRAWVRADADDRPVAYLLASVVDGDAHVEQVSVHPSSGRRGIGAALIDHLASWVRARSLGAVTLTTYTDVPWNGPYYERLGFRYLREDELPPGLRRIRRAEAARGLDRWPRAAMRLPL